MNHQKKTMSITLGLVLASAAFGCQGKEAAFPQSGGAPSGPRTAVATPATGSPASTEVSTVAAHATTMGQPAAAETLSGKVVETMDSGGYTYLKLKTAEGEEWAAVREAKVKKGSSVTIVSTMVMRQFESKTLNRKFDRIVFGNLQGSEAASAAPAMTTNVATAADQKEAMTAAASQHAAAGKGPENVGDVKVPKAEGKDAKTIAEVFSQKTALKDQNVTVRGKVVKSASGIMGRNWLHLRDGSGTADKKDSDLTVTTVGAANVGDVVVVKGTVHLDRDFGAGYTYTVIVEDASVSK